MPWLIAILKLLVLVMLLVFGLWLMHATGARSVWWDLNEARQQVVYWGDIAPIAYTCSFALAMTLAIPATPMTLIGATLFEPMWACVVIFLGAILGACTSFVLGRLLGRDFIKLMLHSSGHPFVDKHLASWDQLLGTHGFSTVLYLRLLHLPYFIPSYLAALSSVRFRDYMIASTLGALPNTFVFVFLGHTLMHAWAHQSVQGLLTWRTPVALTLVLMSASLPWVMRRAGWSDSHMLSHE